MIRQLVSSPVGDLVVSVDDVGRVTEVLFADRTECESAKGSAEQQGRLDVVVQQLREYFAGDRTTFDVDVAPEGTEFQRQVWSELQKIPYGEVTSYGDIARRIGRPRAVRAVGRANGQNPISIVIPCHRVIGSNRTLTGYGGGLSRKRSLLQLEGALAQAELDFG